MRLSIGLGVVLSFSAWGCDAEAPEEDVGPGGYVLLGGDALRSGAELDDGTRLTALPAAITDHAPRLHLRSTVVDLPGDADVLTYAYGDDGRRDTLILGSDVFADRIAVDGDEATVRRFADLIEGSIEAADDGRWVIHVTDAWAVASAAEVDGIVEVFPVDITPEGGASVRARHVADVQPAHTVTIERGGTAGLSGSVAGTTEIGSIACADPIAGVWRERSFRADMMDWHEFTLTIERSAPIGGGITGTIDVQFWGGSSDDPLPSVCDDGTPAVSTGQMTAGGTFRDGKLDFQGVTLKTELACVGGEAAYFIDHFTGVVSNGLLHTVNNDGGSDKDRPYTFRRIACR
jgi:hypothetical protein